MKYIALSLLSLTLVLGSFGAVMAEEAPAPPPIAKAVGDAVPAWEAKTADTGEVVKSSDIKGDYAIIFVNSSCSACRAELGALGAMEYKGLDVYVASVDFNPSKTVKKYRETLNVTYPILDASDLKLAGNFAFGYTPASVIVSDGKLTYHHAGFTARDKDEIIGAFAKYKK